MTGNRDIFDREKSGDFAGRGLVGGGILGGMAAFIGASCCVLPIILFNMGVSSVVIAQLGFFARYTDEFLVASLVFIGAGVFWAFRGGRRPGKGATVMLLLSLVLVGTAYILPNYELDLIRYFGFRGK